MFRRPHSAADQRKRQIIGAAWVGWALDVYWT